jgi:YD repeat-containing protein
LHNLLCKSRSEGTAAPEHMWPQPPGWGGDKINPGCGNRKMATCSGRSPSTQTHHRRRQDYTYDDENRLIQITKGSDTITYACDPLGRRPGRGRMFKGVSLGGVLFLETEKKRLHGNAQRDTPTLIK